MKFRALLSLRNFIWFLCIGNVVCLAAPSPSVSKVVSINTNGGHSKIYSLDGSHARTSNRIKITKIFRNIEAGLRSTFLPSGYPARTPQGYLQYSMWSWIQDLSTNLRSVLASQRVLEGVGVGREGATALSAIMNFLIRDGCGMAATLMFTSVAGSRFNADVKRWRLFADIMVDVGITLEVAATQVPHVLFLPMISVGNMCKAICGVAAGACGGAIDLHWAKGSDISDISAKFRAQHTVIGALGLIFAALFAQSVSQVDKIHLWVLYTCLTALHIFANMHCMRLVAFDSFNTVRMNLIMLTFLDGWYHNTSAALPSPGDLSRQEPLFFLPGRGSKPFVTPIRFGVSFNELSDAAKKSPEETARIISSRTAWFLTIGQYRGRPIVLVALKSNISPIDRTKAYFHALLVASRLEQSKNWTDRELESIEYQVATELDNAWDEFEMQCKSAGWNLFTSQLKTQGYEISLQA